jgi:hypothetical protein
LNLTDADNNADTSWMILLGQGMGLLVELYKITKVRLASFTFKLQA